MREGSFLPHTLSLPISPDPIETHWVWPEMLHIIFEGNKVHINDKTSQSSERGGGLKDRQQSYTESSMQCFEG